MSKQRFKNDRAEQILAAAGEGCLFLDAEGRVAYANLSAANLLGYTQGELVGASHHPLFHHTRSTGEPHLASDCPLLAAALGKAEKRHFDETFCRANGMGFEVDYVAVPVREENGQPAGAVVTFHESRREAPRSQSEALLRALVSSLNETPIVLLARDTAILSIFKEPDGADRYGLKRDAVSGTKATEYLPEQAAIDTQRVVAEVFDSRCARTVVTPAVLPNGNYTYESRYAPIIGPDGTSEAVLSLSFDITERLQSEQTIRNLAFYDNLTGLPNRALFLERLDVAIKSARQHERVVALLFIDLDHFKRVNDTLGHGVGDRLLAEVAERLQASVRSCDTVARADAECEPSISRLGGDEFTILLAEISTPRDAANVAERVLEALSPAFMLGEHEVYANASIGIAIFPDEATDAETLLRNADTAMYSAKGRGRNRYRFYASSMNESASRNLYLDGRLRGALERDEFQLCYQPLRDARTGRITGAEALLRWTDPETGPVPPAEFIPIAEDTGVILSIGEWVMRTACAQWRRWEEEGFRPVRLAVNLSGVQLRQEDLVDRVTEILNDTGVSPANLELEITESTIMREDAAAVASLAKLNEMGVSIALDDFGTGYSSLSYLRRFPIHRVKIDRSFVGGVTTHPDDAALTSAIIAMARSLRLEVVAEGVETPEQAAFLREHGCGELQGYLFSRPVPAADFERFLERAKPAKHDHEPDPPQAPGGRAQRANGERSPGRSGLRPDRVPEG